MTLQSLPSGEEGAFIALCVLLTALNPECQSPNPCTLSPHPKALVSEPKALNLRAAPAVSVDMEVLAARWQPR